MSATSDNIFGKNAPHYYAKGLQVIPLYEKEKRPVPVGWSKYAEMEVEESQKLAWIESLANCNIGLALGKQSGIVVIDIDTEDPKLLEDIITMLPPSPWHRKGKKGMMLAYKHSPLKTFRIKKMTGEMIVECLSGGTQCVLPPSIHPDTLKPYESNCNLYDVVNRLVCLPEDIEEQLRTLLKSKGEVLSHSGWSKISEYVSSGSRDTSLTSIAGIYSYAILRGERTLKEAIGMMRSSCLDFTEQVAGDEVDVDKHITNMLKFLHRDVLEKGKILPKGWDDGYTPEQLAEIGVQLGEDQTEWTFNECRKYLQTVFEESDAGGEDRAEAVDIVLKKIAKSQAFTRIDEDRILTYIKDVSGLGVQIATFRARVRELRFGKVQGNDHSEIARACLLDFEQLFKVRVDGGQFWKWTGSHWDVLPNRWIKNKISENYGHLDACRKNADIKGVLDILSFIVPENLKVSEKIGVNFANGFLTEHMELIPHDPDYGMAYTMPFRYLPENVGKFPMFQEFLDTCWGHDPDYQEKMDCLQEAMAATIFGVGARYQRAILLHGVPFSGKSQLLRIVQSLVPPEGVCSVPPEQWDDKYCPSMMNRKILNICGELSERHLINGQKFKDIVDGQIMTAQQKFMPLFTFRPMLAHWFASNHYPKSSDTSSGFVRRWLALTFNRPVDPKDRKVDMGDLIVANEREAIVAWAAQGMMRLLQNNEYTLPSSHRAMVYEMGNMSNTVRYFLTESGKVTLGCTEDKKVPEDKLYNMYWQYCQANGAMRPVGQPKFRAMMRELTNELNFKVVPSQGLNPKLYIHGMDFVSGAVSVAVV